MNKKLLKETFDSCGYFNKIIDYNQKYNYFEFKNFNFEKLLTLPKDYPVFSILDSIRDASFSIIYEKWVKKTKDYNKWSSDLNKFMDNTRTYISFRTTKNGFIRCVSLNVIIDYTELITIPKILKNQYDVKINKKKLKTAFIYFDHYIRIKHNEAIFIKNELNNIPKSIIDVNNIILEYI